MLITSAATYCTAPTTGTAVEIMRHVSIPRLIVNGRLLIAICFLLLEADSIECETLSGEVRRYTSDACIKYSVLDDYTDSAWLSDNEHYSNLPSGGVEGYVAHPSPHVNGCSPLPPPPPPSPSFPGCLNSSRGAGFKWIVVLDDYSLCTTDKIKHAREAGYNVVVTFSKNNTNMSITENIQEANFPFVVVREAFAMYLIANVSFVNGSFANGSLANITTLVLESSLLDFASVLLMTILLVTACCSCICCICLCCCLCKCQSNPDPLEAALLTNERNRQARRDRQELIESILRQLHQMQLDIQQQLPLGASEAKLLPLRAYVKGQDTPEACVICVDDFSDGETVKALPCNHVFHARCIDEWLSNHSSLCPLCKFELPRQLGGGAGQQRWGGRAGGAGALGYNDSLREEVSSTTTSTDSDSESLLGSHHGYIGSRHANQNDRLRQNFFHDSYGSV